MIKKKNSHPEHTEQKLLVAYIRRAYPKILFTSSVAGVHLSGSKLQQMLTWKRLKDAGYRKGTPDLMIFEPRGNCHGLFIEMKALKKGVVSDEQKEFQRLANQRGYTHIVCKGFDEAKRVLDIYLNDGSN